MTGPPRPRVDHLSACDEEVEGCSSDRQRSAFERWGAQWERAWDVLGAPERARSPAVNRAAERSASAPITAPRAQMPAQCHRPYTAPAIAEPSAPPVK